MIQEAWSDAAVAEGRQKPGEAWRSPFPGPQEVCAHRDLRLLASRLRSHKALLSTALRVAPRVSSPGPSHVAVQMCAVCGKKVR